MKKFILLSLLLSCFITTHAKDINTGLFINSNHYKGEKRTSLSLENEKPISLKKETKLSFDMYIRNENPVFGFVFRIVTNTQENIDLVFSPGFGFGNTLALVINDKTYPIAENLVYEKWIPVQITLSKKDNNLTLNYGEDKAKFAHSFEQTESFITQFGVCKYDKFTSNDSAPINIKNIKIFQNDRLFRYWKLGKNAGNICYDEISNVPAIVTNSHWLIDDNSHWKTIYELHTKIAPQYAFDSKRGIIYIVENSQKIRTFNIHTKKDSVIFIRKGYLAGEKVSQLIFDPTQNSLISYNLTEKRLSYFKVGSSEWSSEIPPQDDSRFWDHTASFYPKDSSLYTFGGYGHFEYNNKLYHINLKNGKFTEKIIPEIFPRYTPTSTIVGDKMYIFGGRGSKQGRQELSPQSFYDLYSIDLKTFKTNKLWEYKGTQYTFMPGSNMVYMPSEKCFYTITNVDGNRLAKFAMNDSTITFIGKSTKEDIQVDYLYQTLYYSPELSKFFAVVTLQNTNSGKLRIFEIDYPTINEFDAVQKPVQKSKIPYFILIVCLLLLIARFWFIRKKKKTVDTKMEKVSTDVPQKAVPVVAHETLTSLPLFFNRTKSSICLLGGFSVYNKNGIDITDKFSPTLKNLLILLIVSSEKGTRRITGDSINQLLWGDKYADSARNNRNVSVRKLRILLEDVGDFEIRSSNYWSVSYGPNIFCDYHQVMEYIQHPDLTQDEASFNKLIELILYGPLLPDIALAWMDGFKSDLSNLVIDLLNDLLEKMSEEDTQSRIRIADAILSHDVLNEEALRIKCRALFYSEKKGPAKNAYDNFCKEYLTLIGEPYDHTFVEIIDKNKQVSTH